MESDHHLRSPSFKSPPSSWIRSRAFDLPDSLTAFFSKIAAAGGKSSRRPSNTSEFRYDPASYALNFEDEASPIDEFPLWSRSFSARLPLPVAGAGECFPAGLSRQLAACN